MGRIDQDPELVPEHGSGGFDRFAGDYETALEMGLRYSGESSLYFAQGRVKALAAYLQGRHGGASKVLDFGCGTGSTAPLLRELPGVARVIGVDASPRLLERARSSYAAPDIEFCAPDRIPRHEIDIVYCNGVLHHIPPAERPEALARIRSGLRPGGLLALFENNPWNPGTRLVMRAIPFDRDALPLSPLVGRRLLVEAGFRIEALRYLFFFPRRLRVLRRLEPRLAGLPLGAQYMVLAHMPH